MISAAKRSGIMLCYPFEEKRLEQSNVGYRLLSSEQHELLSVPHVRDVV